MVSPGYVWKRFGWFLKQCQRIRNIISPQMHSVGPVYLLNQGLGLVHRWTNKVNQFRSGNETPTGGSVGKAVCPCGQSQKHMEGVWVGFQALSKNRRNHVIQPRCALLALGPVADIGRCLSHRGAFKALS